MRRTQGNKSYHKNRESCQYDNKRSDPEHRGVCLGRNDVLFQEQSHRVCDRGYKRCWTNAHGPEPNLHVRKNFALKRVHRYSCRKKHSLFPDGNIFWATIYILLVFVGLLSVAVIAMNWLERKILAHMQVRLGPMRVGPHGLLQPIADAIKLLLKEDIIPAEADATVFWIAPFIVVLAAFTVFVVVPFGPTHAITDMNIGILFMLGVSSLSVLGIVTAGWSSNSHYPLMGALRSSAQMVSYEVAMGLAVVSAIMMSSLNEEGQGTLSMIGIVQAQLAQGQWFIFKFFPLGLIAFGIFAIAMVAETNRAPFDLPEAERSSPPGFTLSTADFAGPCFSWRNTPQ